MSNDPTPPSDLDLGPVVPAPLPPFTFSTTPYIQPIPTSSATVTPAPFPPDVPGALYRDAANNFCRAWVGPDLVGYALVSAGSGWPFTLQVYTSPTQEFLSKWTAQSGT
jgi:hypothetical protein